MHDGVGCEWLWLAFVLAEASVARGGYAAGLYCPVGARRYKAQVLAVSQPAAVPTRLRRGACMAGRVCSLHWPRALLPAAAACATCTVLVLVRAACTSTVYSRLVIGIGQVRRRRRRRGRCILVLIRGINRVSRGRLIVCIWSGIRVNVIKGGIEHFGYRILVGNVENIGKNQEIL